MSNNTQTFTIDTTGATIGDLLTISGALYDAACTFVDWEKVHNGMEEIAIEALIILKIADQLRPSRIT